MKKWTLTELTTAVTGGAFVLTVAYLAGFSVVLGLNLFHYVDAGDYFRIGIAWLVPLLVYAWLTHFPAEFLEVLASTNSRDEKYLRIGRLRVPPDVQFITVYFIVLVALTLPSQARATGGPFLFFLWGIVAALAWAAASRRYADRVFVRTKPSPLVYALFVALPALSIIAFSAGVATMSGSRWLPGAPDRIQLHLNGSIRETTLLMLLTDFVVVRDRAGAPVAFIPRSRLQMIEQADEGAADRK